MDYLSEGKIPSSVIDRSAPKTSRASSCQCAVDSLVTPAPAALLEGSCGVADPGVVGSGLGPGSFCPQESSRNNVVSQWPGEFRCNSWPTVWQEDPKHKATFSRNREIRVQKDPEAGIAETSLLSQSQSKALNTFL